MCISFAVKTPTRGQSWCQKWDHADVLREGPVVAVALLPDIVVVLLHDADALEGTPIVLCRGPTALPRRAIILCQCLKWKKLSPIFINTEEPTSGVFIANKHDNKAVESH